MRRTIEIDSSNGCTGFVYYRGKKVDYLLNAIRRHFCLEDCHKYQITIVEGTQFSFVENDDTDDDGYNLYHGDGFIEFLCKKHFDKIFFVPDPDKKYDITVKKVK